MLLELTLALPVVVPPVSVTLTASETEVFSFWLAVTVVLYAPVTWSPLKVPLLAALRAMLPLDEAANVEPPEAVVPPSLQVELEPPDVAKAKFELVLAETEKVPDEVPPLMTPATCTLEVAELAAVMFRLLVADSVLVGSLYVDVETDTELKLDDSLAVSLYEYVPAVPEGVRPPDSVYVDAKLAVWESLSVVLSESLP